MRIDRIQIGYTDDNGRQHQEDFYTQQIEEFFHFLLAIGYADDITVTKKYSLSEEVLKRLKDGGKI